MADQLAPQFTGAYGHKVVKTPHLDALAARGARFDAAYCNSPLCAPSRAAFMTGQLPSRIGAYDNACEFPSSVPTFAHYLRQQGYRTCLAGRMHFVGPDQLHGFEERLTTDVYPADFAWVPDWENNEQRDPTWYHNMDPVKEAGTAATTFQLDFDDEVAFSARRKLFDYARDGNAPWCMVASFMHPHDPYVARPEFWDLYEDAEIDLPQTQQSDVDDDPMSARLRVGMEADKVAVTKAEIIAARRAYYANVSYFDAQIGALVHTLEQTGALENTVIIVTSDHGDMLGERGLWYKMNFFEHAARVPLVMAGPGVVPGEIGNVCSLVDVLPTLLDIAGDRPELAGYLDGRSLWPLAGGGTDETSEATGEYFAEMAGYPVFMIRRGHLKYVHCYTDPPQLYDLSEDQSEHVNLAADPAYAQLADQLAEEVVAWWDSVGLWDTVVASQKSRRAVHAGMEAGARTDWDYTPKRDGATEYVRSHMDWTQAAAKLRYPPFS